MKTCGKCGVEKPLTDFNRRGSGHAAWCRSCHGQWYQENRVVHGQHARANIVRYRLRNRRLAWDYLLEHPCVDCGETDPVVLEFDHVRGEKVAAVARLIGDGVSVVRLMSEIAKCDVRCANCHRRVTAKRGRHHANLARTEGVEPSLTEF